MAQYRRHSSNASVMRIFTIGHSTRAIADFISLLKENEIGTLVDIRTIPKSRHNPQFAGETLKKTLGSSGLKYIHMSSLGGLRHARKDSPNLGWRNASFRGFADYMQTEEFEDAIGKLIELSRTTGTAIMCAESVPWRCHRSLVADSLVAHGVRVMHIMGTGKVSSHKLTPFAVVEGKKVYYPAAQQPLF